MSLPVVRIRRMTVEQDPAVVELIGLAAGMDQQRARQLLQQYRDDPTATIVAAVADDELVGIAGWTVSDTEITLRHIAVAPHARRSGVGSRLLAAVRDSTAAQLPIAAETDAEAVGFYAANGYTVVSLGEKYPGVERFHVRLAQESAL